MKRNADETELSQFERDVKSNRQQALEGIHETYQLYASQDVKTEEDANRLYGATCYLNSHTKNTANLMYPKNDDGGEVVAMGTEETNACGLLKDQDETRLFGKQYNAVQQYRINCCCVLDPQHTVW